MRYALEVGIKALNALEDYVGHDYALNKMDFIAVDDFLMGAMVSVKGKAAFVSIVYFTYMKILGKLGSGFIQVSG